MQQSCLLFNFLPNLNCYLRIRYLGLGIFETSHPLCRDRSIGLAYRSETADSDSSKNSRCPCVALGGKNQHRNHSHKQARASGHAGKAPGDLGGGSIEAAGDALQRSLQPGQALNLRKANGEGFACGVMSFSFS